MGDAQTETPDYLVQLNEQQRAAVLYTEGPQLVIAGAGSGKTRVLAYKIVHLLSHGYEPWRIMALTFTNKAAREMRERITTLVGAKAASRILMGTFHSVFARMLRSNAKLLGLNRNYTIYDAADSRNLVKTIIKTLSLDEKVYKPQSVAAVISNAKNDMLSPEQYIADSGIQRINTARNMPRLGEIYAAYCARCRRADALDFDDLLYYTNILLRDHPDVRRHYQEFYRYILVDEYQDTNFAQHMIISQLCPDNPGLCVVGDDAQSIYSFRGANIANILNLQRTFPTIKTFKLERNYRSSQNIINAAGSLISKNKQQIPKNVYSENGVGTRIEVVRSYSDYEESFLVTNRISQLKMSSGDTYEDFAILYRTNAQSRILEESLRKRNIPYRIYGGLSFYQRKEVKDALAYFRLAMNPDDEESLKRVINFPARGIGDTTLKKILAAAAVNDVPLWAVVKAPLQYGLNINAGTQRRLRAFEDIVTELNDMVATGATADTICDRMLSLTHMMDEYKSDNTPEGITKRENLEELTNDVKAFVQSQHEQGLGECTIPEYMAQTSLATDADTAEADADTPKVTLMTIHAAKGLEYGNVFVVGVEDDLLPSMMSKDSPAAIEEERRLLYVAITRAKRYCMLSYATSRFRNGITEFTKPSPFLKDIDPKYLSFPSGSEIVENSLDQTRRVKPWLTRKPPIPVRQPQASASKSDESTFHASQLSVGMDIRHSRFGKGTITEVDGKNPGGARIKVRFDTGEIKILMLAFARFTIL